MKDFIIVGHGLAAHVLMHCFKNHGISFTTIGNDSLSNCSRIAAGIWNPVVFKRATKSWLADELIPELLTFYGTCESVFGKKILTHRPIIKPFTEEQEKNLWVKKARTDLAGFIDEQIYPEPTKELVNCNIQNGYGVVKRSGNLNVSAFLDYSTDYFKENFLFEIFDYQRLNIFPDKVTYGTVEARQIIFCEGFYVNHNPYFNWIPLKPAKGEVLTIKAPTLVFKDLVFNKNGFLMDLAPGIFKVGATYEWQALSDNPTEKGYGELRSKLSEMISCDYSVMRHEAGVRPSTIDRRPIIGAHPKYKNLFVFNGFGTKGVMLAPYFAKKFVLFYLQKEVLNPEVDISRFYHFYEA